jgi:AcrR family transcriptional regulator
MVRRRPPDRLDQIVEAGLTVFGRLGFRRTQMSDVAREAGVAPGTLYSYVESKEALFALVLARANDPTEPPPTELPVKAPTNDQLLAAMGERFRWAEQLPALHAAIERKRVTDARAELEGVIGELWDLLERTRRLADVLERSARDWPDLGLVFYSGLRHALFGDLATYIERRAARGHLAATEHPEITARFVIETLTWFARHRHHDPDAGYDDAAARAEIVSLVVRALLP